MDYLLIDDEITAQSDAVMNIVMHHPFLPDTAEACDLLMELAAETVHCSSRKVDKPLVLYGAGELGKMAADFFKRMGIPYLYVVDINAERYTGSAAWSDTSVLKPAEVPLEHRKQHMLAVCVATAQYQCICAPLIQQGWLDIVPFYDIAEAYKDSCPLENGWFAGTLGREDLGGIKFALAQWNDDVSRAHHLQFIAWHLLRREWTFAGAPVTKDDRYFIPTMTDCLHDQEVFVDGGAHHGAISLKFMNLVNHRFKKAYLIEPDKHNLALLRARLLREATREQEKIEILECALGHASGTAAFIHGLDFASQFSPLSREQVPVRALDELDIPATFLKLHLEGWEYDALLGARHTLNTYRPLLAVTTYHNRNGLWMVPAFLMKNLHDYVFLLRLHSWLGTGCVVYAMPRERVK